jgi:protein gp138
MRRQIELPEILDASAQALRDSLYHAMPGIVQAYYATEQTADVQPGVNDVRFDVDTGARISEPWPVIPKVPVAFFKAAGFAVYADLSPGDKVILIAQDLDPTIFRSSGKQADPIDTGRHRGAYWVAIPTDITDGGRMVSSGGALVLGKPGGGGNIYLGSASPPDAVGLASKIDSAVTTIVNAFNGHTHQVSALGAPGGPPLKIAPPGPGTITPAPPSVASGTVKCTQ